LTHAESAPEPAARYFFAVWPDDQVRRALAQWSAAMGPDPRARRVAPDKLHITLAFVGELEAPGLDAVRRAADGVELAALNLSLDRIGFWKRSGIIWCGSSSGAAGLERLAADLRGRLARLGYRVDDRPFVPHVTLYRRARRRPKWPARRIDWHIDGFSLAASRLFADGPRYESVHHWCVPGDME